MVTFPIEYVEVDQLYHQTIAQGLGLIAITGVEGAEGTTTLSKTLAERTAASGQNTLLIDLNTASSILHKAYDLPQNDWYPQQSAPLPIQPTQQPNLSLLSCPKQSASRWEFRDTASLLACFNDLRGIYEVIIVDTSPLGRRNQGNIPPENLCTCADGTLMCVLTGVSSETKVRDAYELLRSVNANIHGAVLNDRFAPSLVSELVRETFRLDKRLPNLMKKLRSFLRNSTLLNQDI
ncbi:cellulose synthase operon protein YhjQ/BcsQ [Terasakiella sp. SH-1]|uniref:cellulose synthase operon protein YhjQ/BcsQ n=1 Tax=Terasakiella sp. SH-1 TaxID=2560057 RepID=UPI001072FFAA|nr:cellulose synthase operon protein YhjQ/BcsQ [Terasakiella sp. SH-1]